MSEELAQSKLKITVASGSSGKSIEITKSFNSLDADRVLSPKPLPPALVISRADSKDALRPSSPRSRPASMGSSSPLNPNRPEIKLNRAIAESPTGRRSPIPSLPVPPKRTEKKLRINTPARGLRKLKNRNSRVMNHVDNFVRLNVEITDADISFVVIADKRMRIEYLAHQIEAEYMHRYYFTNSLQQSNKKKNHKVKPLVCGFMFNAERVSLRFEKLIGDLLVTDDTVRVINTFDDSETSQVDLNKIFDSSTATSTDNLKQKPVSVILKKTVDFSKDSIEIKEQSTSQSALNVLSSDGSIRKKTVVTLNQKRPLTDANNKMITLEDRFQVVTGNKLFLEMFMHFLAEKDFAIENLMFWLDANVFESCPDNQTKCVWAAYIYRTYLASNAPISLNITDEIKKEIKLPAALNQDLGASMNEIPADQPLLLDLGMFDEALEQIHTALKAHHFAKFSKSEAYEKFMASGREERKIYNSAFIENSYYETFKPKLTDIQEILDLVETDLLQEYNDQDANIVDFDTFTDQFKDKLLQKIINIYFAHFNLKDYYGTVRHLHHQEKKERAEKQKRMIKFFGEKLSDDLMSRQALNIDPVQLDTQPHSDEEFMVRVDQVPDILKRKEKKLQTFFGSKAAAETKQPESSNSEEDSDGEWKDTNIGETLAVPTEHLKVRRPSFTQELAVPVIRGPDGEIVRSRRPSGAFIAERRTSKDLTLNRPRRKSFVKTEIKPAKGDAAKRRKKLARMFGEKVSMDLIQQTQRHPNLDWMPNDSVSTLSTIASSVPSNSRKKILSRLNRLTDLLGSPITHHQLIDARVGLGEAEKSHNPYSLGAMMTDTSPEVAKEMRNQYVRKTQKLNKVFGTLPPTEVIADSGVHKGALTKLQDKINVLQEIVDEDSDEEELDEQSVHLKDLLASSVEGIFSGSSNNISSADDEDKSSIESSHQLLPKAVPVPKVTKSSQNMKKSQKRKKANKLKNFFGQQLDDKMVMEQVATQSIEKEIDANLEQLLELKKQLVKLKMRLSASEVGLTGQ